MKFVLYVLCHGWDEVYIKILPEKGKEPMTVHTHAHIRIHDYTCAYMSIYVWMCIFTHIYICVCDLFQGSILWDCGVWLGKVSNL